MKLKFLVLILSAILASGCTQQAGPVNQHDGDIRKNDNVSPTLVSQQNEAGDKETEQIRAKAEQSGDPVNELLLPLAKKVLDPARITSKDPQVTYTMRQELMEFNALILDLNKRLPGDAAIAKVLKDYAAALTLTCEELKATCLGYRYFRLAFNSAQVAKLAAKQETALYYRILYFAVELKQRQDDPELYTMLLARASQLSGQVEEKFFGAAVSEMEAALMLMRKRALSEIELRKFLDDIQIWALLQNTAFDLSPATRNAAVSMIASAKYIYVPGTKTLQAGFVKVMNAQSETPNSMVKRQNILRAQTQFKPAAVDANLEMPLDEISYVLDSVFTGTMSPDTGAEMLKSMDLGIDRFEKVMQDYLRLSFAFTAYESTMMAKDIFSAPVEVNKKFDYVKRRSREVGSKWAALIARLTPVRILATLTSKSLGADENRAHALESLFNTVGKSINLVAGYPHVYILFHQLAQKNFSITIPTSAFTAATYDSGQLMNMLFMGLTYPLLQYSPDMQPLNEFETLYAFDMGIRTSVFTLSGLDVDDLISDIVRRVTGDAVKHINWITDRYDKTINGSPDFQEFKKICQEFRPQNPVANQRRFYFLEAADSPYYGQMYNKVFNPLNPPGEYFNLTEKTGLNMGTGIFMYDYHQGEILEKARTDLERVIRIGETMLFSYQNYLRKFDHKSEADIARLTAKSRAEIDELKSKQKNTLQTALAWFKNYGRCYLQLHKRDDAVKMSLIKAEQMHFRQIHSQMAQIRAGTLTVADANAAHDFTGLPNGFKGSDQIARDGVLVTRLTMLIRMAGFMQHGLTVDGKQVVEPIAPNVKWDFGNDFSMDNVKLHSENYSRFIPYTDDEQTFVDNAMKILYPDVGSMMSWFGRTNGPLTYWEDYISTVLSLYRLDNVVNGEQRTMQPADVMDIQDLLVEVVKMRRDKYEFFTTTGVTAEISDQNRLNELVVDMGYSPRIIQYIYGSLDLPGRLINKDNLGYDYQIHDYSAVGGQKPPELPPRYGVISTAKLYYVSRANTGRSALVVPFNKDLDQFLDKYVGNWTKRDTDGVLQFHAQALSYAAAAAKRPDEDDRPRMDLTTSLRVGAPYYNLYLRDNFDVRVRDFKRDTGSCLMMDGVCPDFVAE